MQPKPTETNRNAPSRPVGGEGRAARLARTFLAVLCADSTVCPAEEFVQKKKFWSGRDEMHCAERTDWKLVGRNGGGWKGMEGDMRGGRRETAGTEADAAGCSSKVTSL
eukprot:SAG31_NODE_879_length_11292_cov_49.116680_1_plen_108_part_10